MGNPRDENVLLERSFPVLHIVFLLGVLLKGINALTELASGSILLAFPLYKLRELAGSLAGMKGLEWFRQHGILDTVRIGQFIAPDTKAFFSWFFLSHGAVKTLIIICLLAGWIWAYPLGILVFFGFVIFQIVQISMGVHTTLYLILTLLDIFVITLTFNEWHHAKRVRSLKNTPTRHVSRPGG